MSTEQQALILERDGPVAIITNNDAPMNRMTLEFIDALELTIPALAQDKSVRAIIIRGAGEQNFSVGMNLKQLGEGIERKGSIDALLDQRLHVLSQIENLEKPVIAVLFGYCLGGGLELPLACHRIIAADNPRAKRSVPPRGDGRDGEPGERGRHARPLRPLRHDTASIAAPDPPSRDAVVRQEQWLS